jgi:plastocyanin/outer membrane murein-binding lipoprotein Lpp
MRTPVIKLAALVAATVLLSTAQARAQSPQASEIEDMRREIRQLRSQVQSLRSALTEAAELDSQRAGALSRALKALSSAGDSTPSKGRDDVAEKRPAPPAPPPPPPPEPVAVARPKKGAESRKAPEGPPPAGIVRGKVTLPKGEPVSYVYVENVSAPPVKDQKHVIEQVGKRFSPPWAVVQRGTTISFPNRDNIYHNVFSLSTGNSFDLGLYSAGESKSHTFNEPGEVEIYCNIHPQMAASTLVVPNRLFAKVKPDGTFDIGGVPAGKRKIVAWAPGSRLASTWVDVEAGESAQVELKLEPKASSHKNKSGQQYGSYE